MSSKLIILHGWKSSSDKWQEVKTMLEKKGIEVFVLDLPGFKPENRLTKPWQLDDYVEWLKQKLNKTRSCKALQDPVLLLGHSFGGRVAIKFALKHPQLLQGLILVSSAGIKDKSLKTKMIGLLAKSAKKLGLSQCPICQTGRRHFYRFILKKTDYLKTDDDLALKETMKLALNEDLLPLLNQIKTKTLLIWGDKDKATPLKQGEMMKNKIQNSQLLVLKGASHTPHLDCPELLSQKILAFLNCKK